MIISASRRTDIPAYYGEWFIRRLREGWAEVPNPYNPSQRKKVSLKPGEIGIIVFWTKYAKPFMPFLGELDSFGHPYYFLYTVNPYGSDLEPGFRSMEEKTEALLELSERIGKERLMWRYDPVIISDSYDASFHRRAFRDLAGLFRGRIRGCITSYIDIYRKCRKNMSGINIRDIKDEETVSLFSYFRNAADELGLQIQSCAEEEILGAVIEPGACIDADLAERLTGRPCVNKKDPGQRDKCLCCESVDIGMYNSCPSGCLYCYANSNPGKARNNYSGHDAGAETLVNT